MNSTFHECWLASSEVISQVLFTSEQPKKNKMAFVDILSQIKLLFGLLVIQLVWCIVLKQFFPSVLAQVADIHLASSVNIHHYTPPLPWIILLLTITYPVAMTVFFALNLCSEPSSRHKAITPTHFPWSMRRSKAKYSTKYSVLYRKDWNTTVMSVLGKKFTRTWNLKTILGLKSNI